MKTIPALFLVLVTPLLWAQMPYSVAWVYTTAASTGNGQVTATTIANTYGNAGHTAAASVQLIRPDGNSVGSNMYHAYTSQATVYMSLCSAWACYDGNYFAASYGTEEYCAPTSQYFAPAQSTNQEQISPFVRNQSVTISPSAVSTNSPSATFRTTVFKSQNCQATGVTIQGSYSIQSGSPQFSYAPNTQTQGAAFGASTTATADWTITRGNFSGTGSIVATGAIVSSTCRVDGQAGREAILNFQ